MAKGLKCKIIALRDKGFSYREIEKKLRCSKSLIHYHCKKENKTVRNGRILKFDKEKIKPLNVFYKTHTTKETADEFGISVGTVKKYVTNKRIKQTADEKRRSNYKRVRERRRTLKKKAVLYKGGKCERCGYDKCIWALDFHHKNKKEKLFSISQFTCLGWEKIKKELDKCMIICANCHREVHHEEFVESQVTNVPDTHD